MKSVHRAEVTASLSVIPKTRLVQKILKTMFGFIFIAGAVAAIALKDWPWYVGLPLAMFGAHIVSEDLTRKGLKYIVAMVKDLFGVVKK